MTEGFRKNMEASLKGYIDNKEDIDRIITKLADMKAIEFRSARQKELLKDMEVLMGDRDMDCLHHPQLTYREMICLLNEITDTPSLIRDRLSYDERVRQRLRYVHDFVRVFMSAAHYSDTIKLFLSISVKGYLEHIAEKAHMKKEESEQLYTELDKVGRAYLSLELTESTTVRQFINSCMSVQNNCWSIDRPIEEYETETRTAHVSMYRFLVRNFMEAYHTDIRSMELRYRMTEYKTEVKELEAV